MQFIFAAAFLLASVAMAKKDIYSSGYLPTRTLEKTRIYIKPTTQVKEVPVFYEVTKTDVVTSFVTQTVKASSLRS
ncbi:hypothetical protein ACN47E_005941 [Coniothyrium glycines]